MLQGLGAGDGPLQAGVRGELLALGLARLQEQGGRDRDQGQRGVRHPQRHRAVGAWHEDTVKL